MTIFDYLADIQTTKSCNLPLDQYSPYMAARWLSFHSTTLAVKLNNNTNVFGAVLDKEQHYKLLSVLTPKVKYAKRISYIKKTSKKEEEEKYQILASNLEISQRELKEMLEFKQKKA